MHSAFLNNIQKQYFLSKLEALTEEGKRDIEVFLENANRRYLEEEKRIEQKYAQELYKINNEVDRDFMTAKKLIEASMIRQEQDEEEALLNQL